VHVSATHIGFSLGLKDFEEYLLFVEGCPEWLYFTLWLKEYTKQYNAWMAQRPKRMVKPSSAYYHTPAMTMETSPALALFWIKAQQTFFAPGAEYYLDVSEDILAPLMVKFTDEGLATTGPTGVHPDPHVFTELQLVAHHRLKLSLDRFVLGLSSLFLIYIMLTVCLTASYYNVGSARAWCGVTAGTVMILAGTIAPLSLNFLRHASRWERLAALPGFWLGFTVIIASLHGVRVFTSHLYAIHELNVSAQICIMIYLFGVFRLELHGFAYSHSLFQGIIGNSGSSR
jgi:hypothetical protein